MSTSCPFFASAQRNTARACSSASCFWWLLLTLLMLFSLAACTDGATPDSPDSVEDKDAGGRRLPGAATGDAGNTGGARVDAGKQSTTRDAGPLVIQDDDGGGSAKPPDSEPQADAGAKPAHAADAGPGGASSSSTPSLPAVSSTDGDGPFKTKAELNSGPSKTSGVFRPTEVGKNGVKHPIFIFGCGGTTTPATYQEDLSRIASHGFVVVGEVAEIGDNGAPLKTAIDWVIAENARADSALYQHLDTTKIALGGHSIGSVNSFYIASDPRLTTTIHIAGGSLDNVRDPFAATTGMGGAKLVHPVAYVCSKSDTFGNVEKTEKDYTNTKAPAFMTVINGADHISATKDGLPVIIAWLRWQLAGETDRRASFLDAKGTFSTGRFVSKSKNW